MAESMKEKLARLEAENAALKAKNQRKQKVGSTEKGLVAVYGVRRFPIALHDDEWTALFSHVDAVKAMLAQNKDARIATRTAA